MRYILNMRQVLLFLYRFCWFLWPLQVYNCTTTSADYFNEQLRVLNNYELVTPALYRAGDLNGEGTSTIIQIGAFGRTYDIVVKNNDKTNKRTFQTYIEYVSRNKTYQGKYVRENDCSFSGTVKTYFHDTVNVVLNYCDGIQGMIQTSDTLIFIEPLRNAMTRQKAISQKHVVYKSDDVKLRYTEDIVSRNKNRPRRSVHSQKKKRRLKRATGYQSFLTFINKSGRVVVLYYLDIYRRVVPFATFSDGEQRLVNTYSDTEWVVKDEKTERQFLLNSQKNFKAPSNTAENRMEVIMEKPIEFKRLDPEQNKTPFMSREQSEQYSLEVLVVADRSVIDFHGKDRVETYILTMMDIAARVFEHESLGVLINFVTVKIHLLDDDHSGFEVYKNNPARTLRSACKYISSLRNPIENHPNHFDFGLALTRKDFGPSGFTQLYSMCSENRSCALVQDEGLTSAFIVAHETGHLLGLEHDGESDASECANEGPTGAIMAPIIQSRYDQYRWSRCSRETLKENIEYFQCVKNRPLQRIKREVEGYGSLYTLTEQCHFTFNRSHEVCNKFTFNPCRELFCSVPGSNKCKRRGPALQGTVCGIDQFCIDNKCTTHTDKLPPPYEEEIVDGNWGMWSPWTQCSRTCAVGIRTRHRECDSPKNSRSGMPCVGKNIEKDVCNTNVCSVESPLAKQVNNCKKINGEEWTVYTDKYFDQKLHHTRTDPKCSFETKTSCTWQNEEGNDIDWALNRGETRSFNTGPSVDNTLQSPYGHYLYVEASSTRENTKERSDLARLVSKDFNIPRVCFTMFYHMFGQNMGKLSVRLKFRNNTEHTLWTKAGNKGDKWHRADILIETTSPYKLVIEAVRGKDWSSDIAIDDLSAKTGFCSSNKHQSNERCKIACRSLNENQFRMSLNITDGERCGEVRSNDICLNGKCTQFGCDNKFGSPLKFDYCGVCSGDGSTCEEVKKKMKMGRLDRGYQTVFTIEKGSTYIDITEKRSRHTFAYGVKKKGSKVRKMIKRGEGYVVLADSVFKFERVNGLQRITSNGPVTEDIEIIIYNYQQSTSRAHLRLSCIYYRPLSINYSYTYIDKGWGPCSKTCSTGRQMTQIACVQIENKIPVDEAYCRDLERPIHQYRQCKIKEECPQEYTWLVGEWGNCSKSCGKGIRTRKVECKSTANNETVSNQRCSILLSQVPPSEEQCNVHACPKWDQSEWGECSASCDTGIKRRTVKCIDQTSGDPTNETECVASEKPDEFSPCNVQPCKKHVYIITNIGQCTVSCGGGHAAQIVFCVEKETNKTVDDKYCPGPSPPRILNCNENPCPEYDWATSTKWTPCSQTCGTGVRTREVHCIDRSSGKPTNEIECPHVTRPSQSEPCNQEACQDESENYFYEIHSLTEASCTVTCGGGKMPQFVFCVKKDTREHVGHGFCTGPAPPVIRNCNTQPCPKSIWKEEEDWGECTKTCGTGQRFKKVACVDSYTGVQKDESECSYMKKPVTAITPCNTHSCDSYFYKIFTTQKCTTTCGGGQLPQLVYCVNNSTKERVDNIYCSGEIPIPKVIKCNIQPCPPKPIWITETEWSQCSQSCGAGSQGRNVICINEHTNERISETDCDVSKKPDVSRLCNTQACEKYVYSVIDEGTCTKTCGHGVRGRAIFCVKEGTKETVDNIYCKGASPDRLVPCNLQACPLYAWRMDSGLCSTSCGEGRIINTASCYAVDKHVKVDDSFCSNKKPTIISNSPCNVAKCPEYEWQMSDLTACSKTCGNGTAIRHFSCIDKNTKLKVVDTNCRPDVKREEIVPCFVKKCKTYIERYSSWGNCSTRCGTGYQTRTFKCLDGTTQLEVPSHFCERKDVIKRSCHRECPQAERLYCDFSHQTFCSWSNDVDKDEFDWLIGNSKSYDIPGGTRAKNGYFAYVEGSSKRYEGETAVLYSPLVSVPSGCLSFKYIKHGTDNAGLLVVKLLTSTNHEKELFEKRGYQGQNWVSQSIPIKMNGTYRLLFEARRGRGTNNGVAIDDIRFEAKDCASTKNSRGFIPRGCREISHLCKNKHKKKYCELSSAFRTLCCKTCPSLLKS